MFSLNGIGTKLLGVFQDGRLPGLYFARLWVIVLFIPVVPLGIYLVSNPNDAKGNPISGQYYFYGRVRHRDFRALHPEGLRWLLLTSFGHGLFILLALGLMFWVFWLLGLGGRFAFRLRL